MPKATIYVADSRAMPEIVDETIDLIVTSPPYWQIKDYGIPNQIGYGQTLEEYYADLFKVWRECYRVLKKGRMLCVVVGDYFARAAAHGKYKVIPIHCVITLQCEKIGFDYEGCILWVKKTTMRTTGGATVMGSFPYPPNGKVEQCAEFILLFRKPGKGEKVDKETKEKSALTKEEWFEYFWGLWQIPGQRQAEHPAAFPLEIPKRLIKMFSFVGDTVLDPFIGSGTTALAALLLNRNCIGYEINPAFETIIRNKVGSVLGEWELEITYRENSAILPPDSPKEVGF